MMRLAWILLAPLVLLGLLFFIAIGGILVMLLWNWLVPPIFGWAAIGFWQAIGLLALCRILFGGWRLHGSGRSRVESRLGRRWRDRWADRWAERWAVRWERMTPEERDRFRQRVRARCGLDPSPDESVAE